MFKKPPISYALRLVSTFVPIPKPMLFSGPGSTEKLADFMIDSGHRRPLLVTDAFLLKNGMLDGLLAFLKEQGCEVTVFDGIIPNPTFAVAYAATTLLLLADVIARELFSQSLLGGSAKRYLAKYSGWDDRADTGNRPSSTFPAGVCRWHFAVFLDQPIWDMGKARYGAVRRHRPADWRCS